MHVGTKMSSANVLRLTSSRLRDCALLKVFPYFYFRAENDAVFDDPEELRRLLPRIAMELERANEIKQQSTTKAPVARTASSNRAKIVAKVCVRVALRRV